jgi:hypothetical protein
MAEDTAQPASKYPLPRNGVTLTISKKEPAGMSSQDKISLSQQALAAASAGSRWGVVSLSTQHASVVPAGRYPAAIGDARAIETQDGQALMLILTFRGDGPAGVFEPDPLWFTIAAAEGSAAASRVKSGLRDLAKLATALHVDLDGLALEDVAAALLGLR